MDTEKIGLPSACVLDITDAHKNEDLMAKWADLAKACKAEGHQVLVMAFLEAGEREKVKSSMANVAFIWDGFYTYAHEGHVTSTQWRDYVLCDLLFVNFDMVKVYVPSEGLDYWADLPMEMANLITEVQLSKNS